MKTLSLLSLGALIVALSPIHAADTTAAATTAVNTLGIDLLGQIGKRADNRLISPYSIQVALAMTYNGADGQTHDEMRKTLHFPGKDEELNASFSALQKELDAIQQASGKMARVGGQFRKPAAPMTLLVADRLFGQQNFNFQKAFLDTVKESYGAPLEPIDFAHDTPAATKKINAWVEEQTRERIVNLIPPDALTPDTTLVLVNALYLKVSWNTAFNASTTAPKPFHIAGADPADVPMMQMQSSLGYAKGDGYTAVTVPYIGSRLQFLVLLPDTADGLSTLESKLSAKMLADNARLDEKLVDLQLPKLKLEPQVIDLKDELKALGMKSAFDPGANFDRIAQQPLFISHVFHKAFLVLDENGTEAAAATAVEMSKGEDSPPSERPAPIAVHVDHPFLFAIQDRDSGACLFLGCVTDPR